VQTYPRSAYDLEEVLTTLGIGEAVVTVMNENGAPTPVAWTRLRAPQGSMSPSTPESMTSAVAASPLQARYGTALDRETAFEILTARMNAAAAAEQAEKDAAEAAKAKAAADKAAAAEERRKAAEAAAEARKDAADRRAAEADRKAAERAADKRAASQRWTMDQVTKVLTSRSTQKMLGGVLEGIFGTRRR
jgi:uncharacterized protein